MIRVQIAATTTLLREGLCRLLATRRSLEVVTAASTREECLAERASAADGVVLIEFWMPNALVLARELALDPSAGRPLLISVPEDESDIIACAEAGVAFVGRDTSTHDLEDAIACCAGGELFCSPRMGTALIRRISTLTTDSTEQAEALTKREHEIGTLLAQGLANREIGTRLCISLSTVKVHVSKVLGKLGARNRTEIAAAWHRQPEKRGPIRRQTNSPQPIADVGPLAR